MPYICGTYSNMTNVLLQAQAQGSPAWLQLVFFGLIGVVFYFFMIRPQQAKQKEAKKFLESLKEGDNVVTIGGLHGKLVAIHDSKGTVTIEADRGVRLTFEKSSISAEVTKKQQAD